MRTLNETEMRAVAGGVAPIPSFIPGPSCDPIQSAQDKRNIRNGWDERRVNEEIRNRFSR